MKVELTQPQVNFLFCLLWLLRFDHGLNDCLAKDIQNCFNSDKPLDVIQFEIQELYDVFNNLKNQG